MKSRSVARRRVPSSFRETEGDLDAAGLRFIVVCARWNPGITEALLSSALEALSRRGARDADVRVVRVPGAFELPAAARLAISTGRCDAVIVLGAILRGETTHHEVLANAVAAALAALSGQEGDPIGFGLLTCDTEAQARERAGKGAEAAEAAIEMANLKRALRRR